MKITPKEEARKLAEAKVLELAFDNNFSSISIFDDRFEIFERCKSGAIVFPFVDLKNGDVVIVNNRASSDESVYYFNGAYYGFYKRESNEFNIEYKDRILIKKTGFNILEYMEAQK